MHQSKSDAAALNSPPGAPLSSVWSGGMAPFAVNSKKLGMWLFIVSDTLTFAAMLLAYS